MGLLDELMYAGEGGAGGAGAWIIVGWIVAIIVFLGITVLVHWLVCKWAAPRLGVGAVPLFLISIFLPGMGLTAIVILALLAPAKGARRSRSR